MNQYKFERGFNIKLFIIITSVLLLISYGIFNARQLLMGPSIEIFSPVGETETDERVVDIKGKVRNMSYLSINERPMYADTEGIFEEKLLLSPGFNIIEIKARDRFKKEVLKTIRLYYKPSTTTLEIINASSTEEVIE